MLNDMFVFGHKDYDTEEDYHGLSFHPHSIDDP